MRLLALEVRSQNIGFVAFEGPTRLLDWGTWGLPASENQLQLILTKKLDAMVALYAPTIIAMHERTNHDSSTEKACRLAISIIKNESKRRSLELHLLKWETVALLFRPYGCETKYQIAATLAEWFEDLSWKLPPERKPWQSERRSLLIFDATALGIAFFAQTETGIEQSQ